ncbi:MAG: hypothetical protein JSW46_04140 [Gemmatimonadota bacterium]|nr:MAG: hypothetical protein JSW46_04140 [Gemmatimonadota bacterium]
MKRHRAMEQSIGFRRLTRVVGILLVLPLVWITVSCENLLEVEDPDVAKEGDVLDPEALEALVSGAIGEFQVGYTGDNGTNQGIALTGGLMADEYQLSGTYPTRLQIDMRSVTNDNATAETVFRNLHLARRAAERAGEALAQADPNDPRLALMYALAGFSYVYFGEHYCSGVPSSRIEFGTGNLVFGEPLTTQEMFQEADGFFDLALALADAGSPEAYLAAVGKGRALLNLDQPGAAATAVAGVPTDFAYMLDHSDNTARQANGIWAFVNSVERFRVTDSEGVNGLPYRTAGDPRVLWELDPTDGIGFDQVTPQYNQLKFPARASDMPVADGVEARLIEAEAALGDPTTFLGVLNTLRDGIGMGNVTDPGTEAGRVDLLFEERAYWLWQTAHRLGDLRRLVRQYGRATESVFPTGAYFKGGTYGTDVNLIIPLDEQNNPNFESCIDRNP